MPRTRYTPKRVFNICEPWSWTSAKVSPCPMPAEAWHHGAKIRDQLLNGELFYTLKEAPVVIERWRIHYNTVRPHRSLGGQPPAPETIQLAS